MLSPRTYLNENPFWGVAVSESHRKRDVFTSLFYEWFYWALPPPPPNMHILFFFFLRSLTISSGCSGAHYVNEDGLELIEVCLQ